MKEMKEFRETLLKSPVPKSLKELKKLIIPPEGVRRNVSPFGDPVDEGNELLDGEFLDEIEEDEDTDEEETEATDTGGSTSNSAEVDPPADESNDTPVNMYNHPEVVKQMLCLERVKDFMESEKAFASKNLYPFFVKAHNLIATERQNVRKRAKTMKLPTVNDDALGPEEGNKENTDMEVEVQEGEVQEEEVGEREIGE